MPSKHSIQICHSDETLVAEVTFWATSAGYGVDVCRVDDSRELSHRDPAVTIMELTGTSDAEIDVIESLVARNAGKVIVVTQLEAKTVASIRRLFHAKSLDAVVLARADFNTRQLADLLKIKQEQPALDREMLAQAISSGRVVVHYQPKVPFRSESRAYGVEALCRIRHDELGLIYPDNFIPLAEAHDLILELTDAVTVQAFRDLAAWDRQGRLLRMAINVSPRLMGSMAWFELFEHRCQEHQIDPRRITLEVTESSSQGGKVLALEILSRLRLKGFLLSIDDFGTGFSSLETLYKLPFGELKIDKGFVFDLQKSAEARTLVESTVSLARKLGLKITAEGVESEETFHELRNLQCDDAQGYFISKPIAADAILPFFTGWEGTCAAMDPAIAPLAVVHGLLADILSDTSDDDDATIVLGAETGGAAPDSRTIAARIPALLLAGDWLGALAHVHRALEAEPGRTELGAKLAALKNELERSLLTSLAVARAGGQAIALRPGDNFTIGRESASANADIAIPCRWLSRGPKNLRLFRQDGAWRITDLGSTNGHFLNGVRLAPNQPCNLPPGDTMLEVGKVGAQPAPAWLSFRVTDNQAVELSYGVCDGSAGEPGSGSERWMLFASEFSLGRDPRACMVLADSDADFAADVSVRDGGLWIAPRPGRTVQLGEHEFSHPVPLVAGVEIRIGSAVWQVEADLGSAAAVPLRASA